MIERFLRFINYRQIRVDIVTVFVLLLLITSLLIILISRQESLSAALRLSSLLTEITANDVIHQSTALLSQAHDLASTSATMVTKEEDVDPGNVGLSHYLLSLVRFFPFIGNAYIGTKDGSFLEAVELQFSHFLTDPKKPLPANTPEALRFINRHKTPPSETWSYVNTQFVEQAQEEISHVEFNPTVRPWYQKAEDFGKCIWSDVYIFNEAPLPGITAACPIFDKEGEMVGVSGIDFYLSAIGNFLKTLSTVQGEEILIADTEKRVIAASIPIPSNPLRLITLDELEKPLFDTAFDDYQTREEHSFQVKVKGDVFLIFAADVGLHVSKPWTLFIAIPLDTITRDVRLMIEKAAAISVVILLVALGMVWMLANHLSKPIRNLTHEIDKIKDFDLSEPIVTKSHIKEIAMIETALASMKDALLSFSLFVPKVLVKQLILLKKKLALGGEPKEVTVSFYDIANFTTISEHLKAQDLMLHLSEYLDDLSNIVYEYKGTIDKYIGDSIMSFWNAPIELPDHALLATEAGWKCQERLSELNKRWALLGRPLLETRMGIHTGEVVVGNIGSHERLNYTIIGSNVNLASRLEGANKFYKTKLIVSATTAERVRERFILRLLDLIAVKGSEKGMRIYEVRATKDDPNAVKIEELCQRFDAAVELYLAQKWNEALVQFQELAKVEPQDEPIKLYIERIEGLLQNPPQGSWDPVFKPEHK